MFTQDASEHPLAKAIVQYMNGESSLEDECSAEAFKAKHIGWLRKVSAFDTVPGKGVRCVVDGKSLLVILQSFSVIDVSRNRPHWVLIFSIDCAGRQ